MKIVVGSTNKVKIGAVESVFRQYYPDCVVVGVAIPSGVAEQPMSEQETIKGARSRAKGALLSDMNADYGVGLEGGVIEGAGGVMYSCAWACIASRDGKEGMGGGLYFELPKTVADGIRSGGELGPLMDQLTGEIDNKHKAGAIGVFTKGKLDRTEAYSHLVYSALVKFVSPEWYS